MMRIPLNRLRLTLRAVMVLIVLLAIPLAWQVNKARRQRDAVAAIKKYGGFVYYDWEYIGDKQVPGRSPQAPQWLRKILGDEFFQDVTDIELVYGDFSKGEQVEAPRNIDDFVIHLTAFPQLKRLWITGSQTTDRTMETIGSLTNLEEMIICNTLLTDKGMSYLKGLIRLKTLCIERFDCRDKTKVLTDETLKSLEGLSQLEIINLGDNFFSDHGLASLRNMVAMKRLYLSSDWWSSDITDSGLIHLKDMRKLESLGLRGSKITDFGLESLSSMPLLEDFSILGGGHSVSDGAIKRLQAKLPNLKSVD